MYRLYYKPRLLGLPIYKGLKGDRTSNLRYGGALARRKV